MAGRPFFLYLAYNAVHGPLGRPAPQKYLKRFHTESKQVDNFYAYLNAADEGIGRIRQGLQRQGIDRNTLIFVLSDNGAPGGSPLPSNAPFLGFKGQVWQGGVRIPMLAWGPGVISSTALETAGIAVPAGIDGRSLLPLLTGRSKTPVHSALFWAGQLSSRWVEEQKQRVEPPAWAVRKGRWMLRYWSHLNRHELYDLSTDRGERHDVAAGNAQVVRELKSEYAQWFRDVRKPLAWDEGDWKKLTPGA